MESRVRPVIDSWPRWALMSFILRFCEWSQETGLGKTNWTEMTNREFSEIGVESQICFIMMAKQAKGLHSEVKSAAWLTLPLLGSWVCSMCFGKNWEELISVSCHQKPFSSSFPSIFPQPPAHCFSFTSTRKWSTGHTQSLLSTFSCWVLRFEPRVFCLPDQCSSTELHTYPAINYLKWSIGIQHTLTVTQFISGLFASHTETRKQATVHSPFSSSWQPQLHFPYPWMTSRGPPANKARAY